MYQVVSYFFQNLMDYTNEIVNVELQIVLI